MGKKLKKRVKELERAIEEMRGPAPEVDEMQALREKYPECHVEKVADVLGPSLSTTGRWIRRVRLYE